MQTHDSATETQEERSYTVAEIRKILKIGRTTSYKLIHTGIFPVRKFGSTIRIPKAPFDEWFDKRNQT